MCKHFTIEERLHNNNHWNVSEFYGMSLSNKIRVGFILPNVLFNDLVNKLELFL